MSYPREEAPVCNLSTRNLTITHQQYSFVKFTFYFGKFPYYTSSLCFLNDIRAPFCQWKQSRPTPGRKQTIFKSPCGQHNKERGWPLFPLSVASPPSSLS